MTGTEYLDELEAESIYILRETIACFRRPVLLYSMGKDSTVLLHLLRKAVYPARIPCPLLHIDTGWKFRQMIEWRDALASAPDVDLIVHMNSEAMSSGVSPITHGGAVHTHLMKTVALKQAMDRFGFDAAIGGARRDEEPSRAKERIFSLRGKAHTWDPRNQRPELWRTYNTALGDGESMRVFPLSNWTETAVWHYIQRENLQVMPLYFSELRNVLHRDGNLLVLDDDRLRPEKGERVELRQVRFRTLGCYPLTSAIDSSAKDVNGILEELTTSRWSERHGRLIDRSNADTMEAKKREGYF